MSKPSSFSAMFSKGDIFCYFLCLPGEQSFPKWGLFSRKEFAPMGANSFPYEVIPIYMGGNNENDRVDSPESVPIHLKIMPLQVPYLFSKGFSPL